MDWKNLEAGKKVAQEQGPDPVEHTPEAPIISEEEAQIVESPDSHAENLGEKPSEDRRGRDEKGNIIDKVLNRDDDTVPEDGSVRVRPHHDE